MMRSQEGRQSRLGTGFHTKNRVICHVLSRLCLNVTPVLITRLTKLSCYSGVAATVPAMQESNWEELLWIITKRAGEAGSPLRRGSSGAIKERKAEAPL